MYISYAVCGGVVEAHWFQENLLSLGMVHEYKHMCITMCSVSLSQARKGKANKAKVSALSFGCRCNLKKIRSCQNLRVGWLFRCSCISVCSPALYLSLSLSLTSFSLCLVLSLSLFHTVRLHVILLPSCQSPTCLQMACLWNASAIWHSCALPHRLSNVGMLLYTPVWSSLLDMPVYNNIWLEVYNMAVVIMMHILLDSFCALHAELGFISDQTQVYATMSLVIFQGMKARLPGWSNLSLSGPSHAWLQVCISRRVLSWSCSKPACAAFPWHRFWLGSPSLSLDLGWAAWEALISIISTTPTQTWFANLNNKHVRCAIHMHGQKKTNVANWHVHVQTPVCAPCLCRSGICCSCFWMPALAVEQHMQNKERCLWSPLFVCSIGLWVSHKLAHVFSCGFEPRFCFDCGWMDLNHRWWTNNHSVHHASIEFQIWYGVPCWLQTFSASQALRFEKSHWQGSNEQDRSDRLYHSAATFSSSPPSHRWPPMQVGPNAVGAPEHQGKVGAYEHMWVHAKFGTCRQAVHGFEEKQ